MSRRLIIGLLIVLIIGTVVGSAYFIIQRLRSGTTATPTPSPDTSQALQEAGTGSQQIADPTADDDNDNLNNSDEALWGTDPKNPDTDGDKYLDGEEVKANYNPTIPAPNDKLPPGFVPGKNIQPLTPAVTEPVAVDQFFQDNLDLSLGTKNYTEEYKQQYPEDRRTPDTLATYAKSQPIITQLPTPTGKSILTVPEDSPLVLKDYLDIAGNLAVFSKRSVLADGLTMIFENENPSIILGLADAARVHQRDLLAAKVPPAALSLQRLLLGYSELLAATYDQLATYPTDQARAVIAMRQLADIDQKYMPLIVQELNRLRTL